MAAQLNDDPIRRTVTVPAPPERAFAVFTEGLATWWPPEYTWSQEALETIAIEPRPGGRCFERGPHGFHCDWGRVVECEAPRRLLFTWQISPERVPVPDPAKASEVEVRFTAVGTEETRVELSHRGFGRHGDGGAGYRAGMDSPAGWTRLVESYAAAVA